MLAKKVERGGEVASDDLYAMVAPSLVVIEKRDAEGKSFGRGLGFFIAPHLLATAFQVVEGARSSGCSWATSGATLGARWSF